MFPIDFDSDILKPKKVSPDSQNLGRFLIIKRHIKCRNKPAVVIKQKVFFMNNKFSIVVVLQ